MALTLLSTFGGWAMLLSPCPKQYNKVMDGLIVLAAVSSVRLTTMTEARPTGNPRSGPDDSDGDVLRE
jgi:hypothetical protein